MYPFDDILSKDNQSTINRVEYLEWATAMLEKSEWHFLKLLVLPFSVFLFDVSPYSDFALWNQLYPALCLSCAIFSFISLWQISDSRKLFEKDSLYTYLQDCAENMTAVFNTSILPQGRDCLILFGPFGICLIQLDHSFFGIFTGRLSAKMKAVINAHHIERHLAAQGILLKVKPIIFARGVPFFHCDTKHFFVATSMLELFLCTEFEATDVLDSTQINNIARIFRQT